MKFRIFLAWVGTLVLAHLGPGVYSYAHDVDWINQQLELFNSNPKRFMNSHIPRRSAANRSQKQTNESFFSESLRQNRKYIENKNLFREKFLGMPHYKGKAPYLANDQPQDLVDKMEVYTLQDMGRRGLTSATLLETPWSDDYWPFFKGGIAQRYADPNFPNTNNWSVNTSYVSQYSCNLDQMSPAEKYDLLVGDSQFTLTRIMLATGSNYSDNSGYVPEWMGYCHGWSAASYNSRRPSQSIRVKSADGKYDLTFYPSDIKALVSLLWANALPPYRSIGGNCTVIAPAEDANGRIIDQNCFDTNPASWHLSVVNQIGISKRSFIMDSTYDYEIWNQPIYSYKYSYFNPVSRTYASSIAEAKIERKFFRNDAFRYYRSQEATSIVGIAMEVTYIGETTPTAVHKDTPENDNKVTITYLYDLEISPSGEIIGGEWYQREHPDFLWSIPIQSKPQGVGDQYLARHFRNERGWDGRGPIPSNWIAAAREASQNAQPLNQIVDTLTLLSNLNIGS